VQATRTLTMRPSLRTILKQPLPLRRTSVLDLSLPPDVTVRSRERMLTSVRDFDPPRAFTLTRDFEPPRALSLLRELVLLLALPRELLCDPALLPPDFWSPDFAACWLPALPPPSPLP